MSIITPLYNGAKTIHETIESILNQEHKDWEWILFDDGSTDGTQDIARRISEDHKDKIFYFQHDENKNCGTAFTRNCGVAKSSSDVISFIDQDDVWYPDRLSYHLDILEKQSHCAMIWGPALYWYKERTFKQPVKFKGTNLRSGLFEPPSFIEIFLRDLKGTPIPSSVLVMRKYFDEIGGYEASIKGSEDIVLWLKIAEKFPIYFDDKVLAKYRKHEDSTLRQAIQSGRMNEWNLIFYKWVIDFLKRNSSPKDLLEENEFAYYSCLKRIAGKKNYFESRKELMKRLSSFPELKKKYFKDYLLDLILPFETASRISAKLRFDLFKNN